ncbi:MAG: aminotransferase class V-fold PLP-dependent enzyme [Planctomycetia bacterium]|nr:aminotransferase class V-fold PLP-dependent enzyme [Planctomycetia bacterium]
MTLTTSTSQLSGDLSNEWSIPAGVTYLNHGSFGPSPRCVRDARHAWSERLESQPMDFYLRQMETALDEAAEKLGKFIGTNGNDLLFCDNATVAMNIVAESVSATLKPGDEILFTDQEYGAVMRIWRRAAERVGARIVIQPMPRPVANADEQVAAVMNAVTERTKLIIVSHITSPTAVIFPVEAVCREATKRGVPVCIDGPHALAMMPLNLKKLGCDFYCASGHKWLSAPFGSGFLYVAKKRQQQLTPPVMSWGGSLSGRSAHWQDEFRWLGTRDPAAFLAIPTAIEFLERFGVEEFRQQTHELAQYARQRIVELTGLEPPTPDSREWYGSMIALPLPSTGEPAPRQGIRDQLQNPLWGKFGIEVPIVHWRGERLLRVSCYLYNTRAHIDLLCDALKQCNFGL